jgi:hypothetical protein
MMKIVDIKLGELIPYENNPRINDRAVNAVAKSISQFGFKQPIVIDRDNVIVAGHTRARAAEQLGLETVPCIRADDLTDEQIRAYRLADNKTAELAEWDIAKLDEELDKLKDLDMTAFGFEDMHKTFKSNMNNAEYQTEDDEYREFEEKFETSNIKDISTYDIPSTLVLAKTLTNLQFNIGILLSFNDETQAGTLEKTTINNIQRDINTIKKLYDELYNN